MVNKSFNFLLLHTNHLCKRRKCLYLFTSFFNFFYRILILFATIMFIFKKKRNRKKKEVRQRNNNNTENEFDLFIG